LGLVGIILTVLYTELEADEPPEQDEEAQEEEAQEEGDQDEAREELAGP
jgi:mannose/fructose/N-acetylgalactosamine-specific phosphotransferase system component IIC